MFIVFRYSNYTHDKDYMNSYFKAKKIKSLIKGRIFWSSVVYSVLLLVFDIVIDTYLFENGDLVSQVLHPSIFEAYFRFIVFFSIITFGIYIQSIFNKLKKTQDSLVTSESHYRTLAEAAQDIIYIIDRNDTVKYINNYGAKILNRQPDEIIGTPRKNLFPPQISANQKEVLQKVFKAGKTINEENKIISSGKEIWLNTTLAPIKKQKDKVTSIVGISRDITKRKETERDLKLFNQAVETALDGIQLTDLEGKITYSNKSITKIFGFTPKELKGKYVNQLQASPEIINKSIISSIKKTGSWEGELIVRRKNNQELPVWLTASVIKDADDKPIAQVRIIRDITEHKREQSILHQAYETEHHIANTLQKSLSPAFTSKIKGLEVKFYYKSATEKAEVGGDFYDLFEIPNIGFGLVMGDVAGKGIDAAAETARVKYLLRDKAYNEKSPAKVLSNVNKALIKQRTLPFVALTYGIYNPEKSEINISNAANPYPYVTRTNTFIEITGVPLSIASKEIYPEVKIKLEKKDVIVMYTDGLTEARSNGKLFGEEGVRRFILKNNHLNLTKLLKGLVKEARDFSNNNLRDDVLIIGIKKR
jgi:PAS domain S-box-containing protein